MAQTTPPAAIQHSDSGGWNATRIAKWTTVVIVVVLVLIFFAGLALALFTDATETAPKVQVVRDIVIIVIAIEGILIIVGLAVLIAQIARLVNLLQNETRPILDNAAAAVKSAKGTAEFVGDNVAEPIIKAGGFVAGLRVFLRELGGIRRAIRRREETHGTES